MQVIADLQLHSKYSRAVSQEMVIPKMYEWGLKKGIGLLATGDWTHPLWIRELKANLEEQGNGLLKLKKEVKENLESHQTYLVNGDLSFLLSGEVSCIYSHHGKTRRNHLLLFAPSFATVDKINAKLVSRGCNLSSDGRPIIGLTSQEVCELVWSVDERVLVIPAHAWTPWFSLFGSMSGYDTLAECFGNFADKIYAIETGLSSDPAMNWRIKELDTKTLISCSDSHSGSKLMREATIFDVPNSHQFSFDSISTAIKNYQRDTSKAYIAATIEFYPQEGKYHYSGHRSCQVRLSPMEIKKKGKICPVCGRPLTIGVLDRVEALADRSEQELQLTKKPLGNLPVKAIYSNVFTNRAPYVMLVPLLEIIAEALKINSYSQKGHTIYEQLVGQFGGEFNVLIKTTTEEITKIAGERVANGVEKVRSGDIVIEPGFDGVFGVVKVFSEKGGGEMVDRDKEQMSLF